jgi:large subunit ribosomal protein L22
MEVKAEHRYAKISAFKVREVTREIQGLHAVQALEIVRLIPKKSARLIGKVLASAIANAENNNNLRPENLIIKEAVAGEGPTLKRMHTRARGSGARINKRMAHIKVILTEAEPIEKTVKPKGVKKTKPAKSTTKVVAKKDDVSAAPALAAPEPDASELRAESADKTSKSLAAGEHPEKVTSAD